MFGLAFLFPFGAGVFWYLSQRKKKHGPPPSGIVLLLQRPLLVNAQLLAGHLSEVTGRKIDAMEMDGVEPHRGDDAPADDVVIGRAPHLMVIVKGTYFLVHSLPVPYMADPHAAAADAGELRMRKAISQHRAWFSMDILHPEAASPENYRIVGRLLARLIGDECLALYHPPSNGFAAYGKSTPDLLQGEDPVRELFGELSQAPVIPVDEDPRLKAAEAEARRRFSEFEQMFRQGEGSDFAVKVSISGGGNTEHVWVDVQSMTEHLIDGVLANDPVDLGELRLGSKVRVRTDEVEDWTFLLDEEVVGGFTAPAIAAILEERLREG